LLTVTWLSFVCIFLLPRQFHVTFVENVSEDELRKASWLFPMYLILINIFVVPIAMAGSLVFQNGVSHDKCTFWRCLLMPGARFFTFVAFLGGLSAATAMVVVETVALSIMVCNDLLDAAHLKRRAMDRPAVRILSGLLLNVRRAAVVAIILLAYGLYDQHRKSVSSQRSGFFLSPPSPNSPLPSSAVSSGEERLPEVRRRHSRGFAVWAYTLLLPT